MLRPPHTPPLTDAQRPSGTEGALRARTGSRAQQAGERDRDWVAQRYNPIEKHADTPPSSLSSERAAPYSRALCARSATRGRVCVCARAHHGCQPRRRPQDTRRRTHTSTQCSALTAATPAPAMDASKLRRREPLSEILQSNSRLFAKDLVIRVHICSSLH